MREFAKSFYASAAWHRCREAYLKQTKGLCEECALRGLYVPADTVHHIIHITPQNINDPAITLNPANLRAVCRDCHATLHKRGQQRYKADELGRITII